MLQTSSSPPVSGSGTRTGITQPMQSSAVNSFISASSIVSGKFQPTLQFSRMIATANGSGQTMALSVASTENEKSPLKPDQKMFHMMIYMHRKAGNYEKARKFFSLMAERGVQQSTVTYNSLMSYETNYKEVSNIYDQLAEYVSCLDDGGETQIRILGDISASADRSSNDTFFWAVLLVRRGKYDKVREFVERARRCLATKLAALVLESYERSYSNISRHESFPRLTLRIRFF
ncbi:hypothetical protein Nepgr_015205 [Nepenthes gracilis]|uniref:PIK-related kinase FAT domain-containing protein n=1 Tax=Nepenthes gracilis TaxID=150966 RepID=A0AAD3XQW6_NEPGR|nr:hypothetical protein Nepgr_015205 [Nepenthes gracilis]